MQPTPPNVLPPSRQAALPRAPRAECARRQLAAGQVDSPLRRAEIAASPPGVRSGYLPSVLAMLRAQRPPFLVSSAKLGFLADGQEVAQIVFTRQAHWNC